MENKNQQNPVLQFMILIAGIAAAGYGIYVLCSFWHLFTCRYGVLPPMNYKMVGSYSISLNDHFNGGWRRLMPENPLHTEKFIH